MKKLYRNPKDGYLGGICHGLGKHTDLDPILWRLMFLFFFGPIYFLLWLFVKKEPCCEEVTECCKNEGK